MASAVVHEFGGAFDVFLSTGQDGGHVFSRVVGFQVGGLVGYPRVACGVGFVEGIGGEFLPVFPYLVEFVFGMSVGFTTFVEENLEFVHFLDLLLAHGFAEGVALAAGESCQLAGEKHDLLLVYGDAIGVLEVLFHAGDVVFDRFASLLAVDEVGNVVHRTRTVERVHSDEVFKDMRLQFAEVFLHAGGLELERAHGVALTVELVSLLVVDGNVVNINVNAVVLFNHLDGVLDDSEVLEAEEVHFDKSNGFNHVAIVLCNQNVLFAVLVVDGANGCYVGEVVGTNNHAAGMNANLSVGVLELGGIGEHVFQHIVAGVFHDVLQLGDVFIAVYKVHFRRLAFFVLDIVWE